MNSADRILVIGPAWIGDMVMAQSLFKTLKVRRPGMRLSVVAPTFTAKITTRMPEVDEVIETPFHHGKLQLGARLKIGQSLRVQKFDQAIILPGSTKAALLPFFARIPVRTGYRGEPRRGLINDLRDKPGHREDPMAACFVQLGLAPDAPPVSDYPAPRLITRPQATPGILAQLGHPTLEAPVLALCPGAEYGPAKRWPAHHFVTLANHYLEQGWQTWLLGGEQDQPIARAIMEGCRNQNRCLDLTGRTSLLEAVDLLSQAQAVVSNDSGLMHIAAAAGGPVVGIFGSSSALHTPPLSNTAQAVALDLACRPCFARQCPLGHLACLDTLAPQQVIDALASLLMPPLAQPADIIRPCPPE